MSALIDPDYSLLEDSSRKSGINYSSREELCAHPQNYALMEARIETLQQQLASYEKIKRFTLLPKPFTMERGELTNTLKIKRKVLAKNYAAEIDLMYEETNISTRQ